MKRFDLTRGRLKTKECFLIISAVCIFVFIRRRRWVYMSVMWTYFHMFYSYFFKDMPWLIQHSLYQYTLRLLPNLYFWSLFGVPWVRTVHWPHYCCRHKYLFHFSAVQKIMLNATWKRLCPYLKKTKKTSWCCAKKPLNSGSSGSNQLSLKRLLVLTYLFLGWSHGLLTTIPLLWQFHCDGLAAARRLLWANTHRQRRMEWRVFRIATLHS